MARHLHADREPRIVAESRCLGPCDPAERIHVTIMLRRQEEGDLDTLLHQLATGDPNARPLSRDAFAQRFSAAPDDIRKTEDFARRHQLTVERVDPVESVVVLSGTIQQFETAFAVKLERFEHRSIGQYRGRSGAITLPDELGDAVTAVLGLDSRPQARPHFRLRPPFRPARGGTAVTFTPPQLAALYGFPAGDGAGQCIAIIELGGGYRAADIAQYFRGLGIATPPTLVDVNVGTGRNAPTGDPSGPDGEVALDIEIAGAIAPAATIAVYFAPNSDAGFIQAVNAAVNDTKHRPSVISISWGGPEAIWQAQSAQAFNRVLQAAAAQGITVCAASGDSGSGDGLQDGAEHVDFPASSPYVLGCGGTHLDALPGQGIRAEVVWNDDAAGGGAGGGGVSTLFDLPAWQQGLAVTRADGSTAPLAKRGVPDVAGDASPLTGYEVAIAGTPAVLGGTSAVAPLWAALLARINAAAGASAGWINPVLYRHPGALRDITEGANGTYAAARGWDACTGLGSPNGTQLAAILARKPSS
ncbi:protease pro-enzyme activation domain-containing protein [Burkholderia stagnalis]|uniref:S53 family peptidase n=1 Tax=Burkholderia stagnalis TaxID=1503054 RepID=UPI000754BC55|nr:S53 family peptidase [Burkholderia stagnalis]KVO49695.1 peptidase S53 [Burkholderia stagnalis]KVP17450.1 peptidase S53 [Burkholderia stagnalis]KVW91090.1 peptidase S53 [Burkholderia stagnalis]KWH78661.1 peptidase S53 [Burkholderia stagnalis]KWK23496.1 peptidase S53 [Burkholderia stagnalis]